MRISLDTNRYTDMARGDADAVGVVTGATEVFLPLIVVAELRAGFRQGNREAQNEAAFQAFLGKPGVAILLPDVQTTFHYASVEADLRKKGRAIPTNDVWIAALTLQHGLTLYSRDGHFDNIPTIARI